MSKNLSVMKDPASGATAFGRAALVAGVCASLVLGLAVVPTEAQRGERGDAPSREGRDKDKPADKERDKDKPAERAKDDETRPVRYSFPTAVPGVELGRAGLEAAIARDSLDGQAVVDSLFGDFELIGWAQVVRSCLGTTEFAALDRELDGVDLAGVVRTSGKGSDRALATALDAAKVSSGDLKRGMKKVFDEWRGNETAAYFARQGLAEAWMAARLGSKDRTVDGQKAIGDMRDRDMESPSRLLQGELAPTSYEGLLEVWLGLPGRPDKREVEFIFREEGKVLTPEVLRVLNFGDSVSAAKVLTNAGIGRQAFLDQLVRCWRPLEKDDEAAAKRLASHIVDGFERRLRASQEWLNPTARGVKAVYSGSLAAGRGTPVLGALEGDGKEAGKLADLGISESIASYFSGAASFRLVLHSNNSVRAMDGATRYEGKWDAETGKLDLVAVYGGRDLKLEGVKLHGGGLLMELAVSEAAPERAKRLLRRSRSW